MCIFQIEKLIRSIISFQYDECQKRLLLCYRFAAVVELEMALVGNPDKKMLMRALARRRDNQFDNFFDRLITELFITGTRAALHAGIEARRCNQLLYPHASAHAAHAYHGH